MHILMAHEYYRLPGGEDETFEGRRNLLRARGHRVTEYVRRSAEIEASGPLKKAMLPLRAIWSSEAKRDLARMLAEDKPDVAHFSNTFPLISPSVYWACREAGVPVLQNLENPRLMCPSNSLFRDGKLCHDCVGRFPWPGIVHGCYHGSAATAVVAGMVGVHRLLDTWNRKVDGYLVATEFYRRKFIEIGIREDRLHLCPLPVEDPGARPRDTVGDYALYLGRLAPEKGTLSLLEAWKDLEIPLKIRGSGEHEPEARALAAANPHVELLGRLTIDERNKLLRGARFLVWPSLGEYETCGLVVTEAFACGVPVLASRTGVATERVVDGQTGIHFEANDPADLARKARWCWEHPAEMSVMGRNGRVVYEQGLTASNCIDRMLAIYKEVLDRQQAVGGRAAAVAAV